MQLRAILQEQVCNPIVTGIIHSRGGDVYGGPTRRTLPSARGR
jgi:hypothetical protein